MWAPLAAVTSTNYNSRGTERRQAARDPLFTRAPTARFSIMSEPVRAEEVQLEAVAQAPAEEPAPAQAPAVQPSSDGGRGAKEKIIAGPTSEGPTTTTPVQHASSMVYSGMASQASAPLVVQQSLLVGQTIGVTPAPTDSDRRVPVTV